MLLASLTALLVAAPVSAVDHNNLDDDRPLGFDDAESIALHERSFEGGLRLSSPRGRAVGLQPHLEYLYGVALNTHVNLGITPTIGGRADSRETSFDVGDLSIGALRSFNREIRNTPAFALRGDLFLPTGRNSRGVGFRLRGIASKSVRQYDRLHANLDLNVESDPQSGDRRVQPGLVLGYSRPLGYPRRFNRTGLAELGVRSGSRRGSGPVILAGVGLRQQVTVRSVFDVGLESDVAGFKGALRDRIRLIAGYSVGY